MENLNLPPFYPGQKVVALFTANHLNVKKGDTLTVHSCQHYGCSCGWVVFINELPATNEYDFFGCEHKKNYGCPSYFGDYAYYFAPLEEKFEHISLSKVIEIETCLVSEN